MRYNNDFKGCSKMVYVMIMCLFDIVELPKVEIRSDKLTGNVRLKV